MSAKAVNNSEQRWYRANDAPSIRMMRIEGAFCIEKEDKQCGIYEELQARGLIAQVTDEPEIRELINNGGARFYIGFDPTADSLHVGHFMALCLMKRLQLAGNRPIVLIGGGTGYDR